VGGIKDRLMARLFTRFSGLGRRAAGKLEPLSREFIGAEIPWTPLRKPLNESRVALITTAGVHCSADKSFDMIDPDGDPSFRAIPSATPIADLTITHDYYNHSDADKDINIVYPIERLRELQDEGFIKDIAPTNYGFMGHIVGAHLNTLINTSAPEILKRLKAEQVDIVLLTPG
jgi:D-proline reductase (dithiol) PrdB